MRGGGCALLPVVRGAETDPPTDARARVETIRPPGAVAAKRLDLVAEQVMRRHSTLPHEGDRLATCPTFPLAAPA